MLTLATLARFPAGNVITHSSASAYVNLLLIFLSLYDDAHPCKCNTEMIHNLQILNPQFPDTPANLLNPLHTLHPGLTLTLFTSIDTGNVSASIMMTLIIAG